MLISDALAANIRSMRARKRLGQADVSERMQALGFTVWRRQTVANVEQGKRRVTAEEVIALALIFGTTAGSLLDLSANGTVLFPCGQEVTTAN